jgi:23S rRNA (guanine745-N1)-methyltransferase
METMLSDVVQHLRCPICHSGLVLAEFPRRALACEAGHSFDAAKQGYFNLLTGKGTAFEADSADMVAARDDFLGAGHYAPLADALAHAAEGFLAHDGAAVLDAGTGTGHYLHRVLQGQPAAAIGLDISKYALRRAARRNPEAANLVWDIWRTLPLADHSMDVVMVVFAPRNPPEFARVLRPGGRLIVVTPSPGHLAEIAGRTGMLSIEEGKAERLGDAMAAGFELVGSSSLDIPLELKGEEVANLAFMGPAGHHLDREKLIASIPSGETAETTARLVVSLFKPRG